MCTAKAIFGLMADKGRYKFTPKRRELERNRRRFRGLDAEM